MSSSIGKSRFLSIALLAFCFGFSICSAVSVLNAEESKKALTIDDLLKLKRVGNPQLSPEGQWVAYTITEVDLEKDKSETLWSELACRIEKFVEGDHSPETHILLSQFEQVPQSFQNLLCLLGAESSRRRGWETESKIVMEYCDNPIMHYLWDAWCNRLLKNSTLTNLETNQ